MGNQAVSSTADQSSRRARRRPSLEGGRVAPEGAVGTVPVEGAVGCTAQRIRRHPEEVRNPVQQPGGVPVTSLQAQRAWPTSRAGVSYNLPVARLIGFFLVVFAALLLLREVPVVGAVFRIPLF